MRDHDDTEVTVARLREQVLTLRKRQRELDVENARLRGALSVYPTPMQLCASFGASLVLAIAALAAAFR